MHKYHVSHFGNELWPMKIRQAASKHTSNNNGKQGWIRSLSGPADSANSWYLVSIWQCIGRDFSQLKIINRWGTQIKYSGSTQIYFSGRCVQERRRQPVMARILMCAVTISNDIYVGACSWTYKMLPVLVWFSLLEFIHHHAELVSQGLECLKVRS